MMDFNKGLFHSICLFIWLLGATFSLGALGSPEELVIESITCSGNSRTSCAVIKEELYLYPGDNIDEEEIEATKIRLGLRGLFESVEISLEKGSSRGKVHLILKVVEASPYYSQLSTGNLLYGERSSQIGELTLGNRNIFGTGKVLQLSGRYQKSLTGNNMQNFYPRLDYIDPHFLGMRALSLTASLGYLYSENTYSSFDEFRVRYLSSLLAMGYRISPYASFTFGYRHVFMREIERLDNGLVERKPFYEGKNLLFANFNFSSADDLFFPTRGTQLLLTAGLGLNSDEHLYLHYDLGLKQHFPLRGFGALTLKLGGVRALDDGAYLFTPENEDLGLSARFSFDWKRRQSSEFIHDARLYFEPGFALLNYTQLDDQQLASGIKTGLQLNLEHLGQIQLFFLYLKELGAT